MFRECCGNSAWSPVDGRLLRPAACFRPCRQVAALACLLALALWGSARPAVAQADCSVSVEYQDGAGGYAGTAVLSISTEDLEYTDQNGVTFSQGSNPNDNLPLWKLPDYEERVLLRFGGLAPAPDMEVQSATLQVAIDNGAEASQLAIAGYYLQSDWDPTSAGSGQGVGWRYRKLDHGAGVAWVVPGLVGGADLIPGKGFSLSGGLPSDTVTKTVALDPAIVQNWCLNPSANQGLLLVNSQPGPTLRLYPSWNPNPSLRPKLTIVWAPRGLGLLAGTRSLDGRQFNLQWKTCPGQMQQVQYSSDLQQWTTLPPVLLSVSDASAWSDDGLLTQVPPGRAATRFYRLLRFNQPFSQSAGRPISFLSAASGLSYLWDFGDGATSTAANPTHAYSSAGAHAVTLTVTDASGAHTGAGWVASEGPCRILLTPAVLASLRQNVPANTPQWQSFKSRLDAQLDQVVGPGAYQGSELEWLGDYALGYKILETIDWATATRYADKAISLIRSGLQDLQWRGYTSAQFLARGDGSTTTFTLPNADVAPSSLQVFTSPIQVIPLVRSAAAPTDTLTNLAGQSDFDQIVLKISNTPDGPADYQPGTDWRRNPDLANDLVDWSAAAHAPAPGSEYYVTEAQRWDQRQNPALNPVNATLANGVITFASPPARNQAIFVQYVYGTHAADLSTLGFQQTSAGGGGFNSIFVDSGYGWRYLGKFLGLGFDWLNDYAGFSGTLKDQTAAMLARWSDYWRDHGYLVNSPASNYAADGYASRVMTALALSGDRDSNGARLLAEVVAYRQDYVAPLLTNSSTSYAGGFWAEGWNYGEMGARNLLLAGLTLESAGLGGADAERQWAPQVVHQLIEAQPTPGTIYDGGDWYAYPAPFVSNSLLYLLAATTRDTTARSYANYIIQNYSASQTQDFQDLLFRDPNAAARFWSAAPRDYYAPGTGLITARADWNYDSTWLAFQLGNVLNADHQTFAQGQLQIQRGGDDLLINANSQGGNQDVTSEGSFGNLVAIGSGTDGFPFNQGWAYAWFGSPGCFISAYEAAAGYVYAAGDYTAAYGAPASPGKGNATRLTRQIVYLRPDYVAVHDRAAARIDSDPKELRWHFLNAPVVNPADNSWVAAAGTSRLFGRTFSSAVLSTASQAVLCPPLSYAPGNTNVVYRIATWHSQIVSNVTYVTALQVAPASTPAMVTTVSVRSADGRMEGIQLDANLVLFGVDGVLSPFSGTLSYTASGATPLNHLLTDLEPNRTFEVRSNGNLLGMFTSSSQGTLAFASSGGGSQVITIR